ncbi:MAG: TRAP transporter fused permease subunit [Geminicoccaceae bacterium]|nr:TRAP transporter fused permease subunit [Geminicoccaceae bacterium]
MREEAAPATLGRVVRPIAVLMSLWHLWAVATAPPEAFVHRAIHLLFASVLVFLSYPSRPGRGPGVVDFVLLGLSGAAILYPLAHYDYLVNRIPYVDEPTATDLVFGVLLVGLVLEATRRCIGWALPLTALAFLAYALLFTTVEPTRLIDQLYLTTEGIFGSTLGVSASYVIVFVLLGAFMERSGTGRLFMDLALALAGRSAGGPGKVSVVSSSLFGTISGSAVANVMVDGPITIPLMKRSGFRPPFAAAVEAVASTGGQIMPPVMGAAAFVMAEFLAVPYARVALWALVPALLYYLAVFLAVHLEAREHGLAGLPDSEVPRLGSVLAARGHLFAPILVLLGGMGLGYSAPLCALAGTLVCLPAALLRRATRAELRWSTVIEALEEGARNTLPVALACACAGIVIGTIALTGLGVSFTAVLVKLAQNSLFLALLLTMAAGIVLGMGMPTTPAYIVMVALLVPALVKLGVVEPAAHMFAFYFAILSAITPPVALAVYAAAGLARSGLWATGLAAVRIGVAGFIVPFLFVYQPELLLIGEPARIALAVATAALAVLALAAALAGRLLRSCTVPERLLLGLAAVLLASSSWPAEATGFALLAGLAWVQRRSVVARPSLAGAPARERDPAP